MQDYNDFLKMQLNVIHNENCLTGLKRLPDCSVDCCVTSPPYFGLRDYGNVEQIGMEKTPEEYVSKLVVVFTEVNRVLKDNGTLWLNLGDSYAGSMNGQQKGDNSRWIHKSKSHANTKKEASYEASKRNKRISGIKAKDLYGIPWMVAFALRSAGWYLRQDIIWHKPNPMPESVTDRCTKSHEYIFLLSKSAKYYYDIDSIRTVVKDSTVQRMMQQLENQKGSGRVPGKTNGTMKAVGPGRTVRKGVDTAGGNQGSTTGNTSDGYQRQWGKRSFWKL